MKKHSINPGTINPTHKKWLWGITTSECFFFFFIQNPFLSVQSASSAFYPDNKYWEIHKAISHRAGRWENNNFHLLTLCERYLNDVSRDYFLDMISSVSVAIMSSSSVGTTATVTLLSGVEMMASSPWMVLFFSKSSLMPMNSMSLQTCSRT